MGWEEDATIESGNIPRAKKKAVGEVVCSLEGYSVSPGPTAGGHYKPKRG